MQFTLSILLLAGLITAVGAAPATATDRLTIGIENEEDAIAVTVSDADGGVTNATVTVESNGNYAGEGTFTTGATGSVDLPPPNEAVDVTIVAESDNRSSTTGTKLREAEHGEHERNDPAPVAARHNSDEPQYE